jgi:hypothetical protein
MFLVNNPLTSSANKIASILSIFITILISGCGGGGGDAGSKTGALTPDSIIISNTTGTSQTNTQAITVTNGQPTTFTATATYIGGPNQDVTGRVTWTYDKNFIGNIDSKGVVTIKSVGVSTVQASLDSKTSSIQFTVNPLASPLGVQAVSDASSVTLSWVAVADATAYNIYFAGNSGVSINSTKVSSNSPAYVHTGLAPGTTYYYRVSAIDVGAESPLSAETFSFVYNNKGSPAATLAATGNMSTPRSKHTATALADGKVLVAGGLNANVNTFLASAEVYDYTLATPGFSTTGSMTVARYSHTATLLPNGKVLVAGGGNAATTDYYSSAEIYDPALVAGGVTGTFTATTGSMAVGRINHTATLLPNGKVLIIGGNGKLGVVKSAELYDPATQSFGPTGDLITARYLHTATLLADGTVLVTGGRDAANALSSAELYDPGTGKFSAVGDLLAASYAHTATLLPDRTVLIAGGFSTSALKRAELYDPASKKFTTTGSLNVSRNYHTANLLFHF